MKWYHFALFFFLAFSGFSVVTAVSFIREQRELMSFRQEYTILSSAVDAALTEAYEVTANDCVQINKKKAKEVFLQTRACLYGCSPDSAMLMEMEKSFVCMAFLDAEGVSVYVNEKENGFSLLETMLYNEDGSVPDYFFELLSENLNRFSASHFQQKKEYRVINSKQGLLENGLKKNGIFAVTIPFSRGNSSLCDQNFVFAASSLEKELFVTTEDGFFHFPACVHTQKKKITGSYYSQKTAAEHGGFPCPECFSYDQSAFLNEP